MSTVTRQRTAVFADFRPYAERTQFVLKNLGFERMRSEMRACAAWRRVRIATSAGAHRVPFSTFATTSTNHAWNAVNGFDACTFEVGEK
jgi:hypothetical protein